MWSALFTGFIAFSLGVSSASANAICDTRHSAAITDSSSLVTLQDTTQSCIKHVCSMGLEVSSTKTFHANQCGQLKLTVTNVGETSVKYKAEDCIDHFRNILNECVTVKGAHRGTYLTNEALYEAYVVIEQQSETHDNFSPRKDAQRDSPRFRRKATNTGATPKAKITPKVSPVAISTPTPKPKPIGSQQNCQGQKRKGSRDGAKTVRGVFDTALSYILRRAPPAPGSASCASTNTIHFEKLTLNRGKAYQYAFDSSSGWENTITDTSVKAVLRKMNPDGKFNVVLMNGAQSYCIGDPSASTNPKKVATQAMEAGEKCLLTNGNFFVVGNAKNIEFQAGGPIVENLRDYNHFAVGFTTSTSKQVDIPADHAQYYEKFTGNDGTSLMCGPGLKEPLDLNRPELQYWCDRTHSTTEHALPHPDFKRNGLVQSVYSQIPGGLATSNQPNERLVTVVLQDTRKLVFSYTSRRSKGVNVNDMRALVEVFLAQFLETDMKTKADQVLNLDGGGSIFVAWVKNKRWHVIAAGNLNGAKVPPGWQPRTVTTMIKHSLE